MGFVSDTVDSITGKGAQKAAKEAGKVIQQSAEQGAALTDQTYQDFNARLQPYAGVGQGGLNGMQQIASQPDNSYNDLRNNTDSDYMGSVYGLMRLAGTPYQNTQGFQDASTAMARNVNNNNAARGKLGSGNTLMDLFRENASLGENIKDMAFQRGLGMANFKENAYNNDYTRRLNTEQYGQNVRSNQFNRYGSLADMGFNALNNQATLGTNAASNISNLRTGGASANAAALIGAQNARDQGVNNMISLASMAAGMYGGGGSAAAGSSSGLSPVSVSATRKTMM